MNNNNDIKFDEGYSLDLLSQCMKRVIHKLTISSTNQLIDDIILAEMILRSRCRHKINVDILPLIALLEGLQSQIDFEWLSLDCVMTLSILCRNYTFMIIINYDINQENDEYIIMKETIQNLIQHIEEKWKLKSDCLWLLELRTSWQAIEYINISLKHKNELLPVLKSIVQSTTKDVESDQLNYFLKLKVDNMFLRIMKFHIYMLEHRDRELQNALYDACQNKETWEVLYCGIMCLIMASLRAESVAIKKNLWFGEHDQDRRDDINIAHFSTFDQFWWYDNWRIREAALIGLIIAKNYSNNDDIVNRANKIIKFCDASETNFYVLQLLGTVTSTNNTTTNWCKACYQQLDVTISSLDDIMMSIDNCEWIFRGNVLNYVPLLAWDTKEEVLAQDNIIDWIKNDINCRIMLLGGYSGSGRTLTQLYTGLTLWLQYSIGDYIPIYYDGRYMTNEMSYHMFLTSILYQNGINDISLSERLRSDNIPFILFFDNTDFEQLLAYNTHINRLLHDFPSMKILISCTISQNTNELLLPTSLLPNSNNNVKYIQLLPFDSTHQLNVYIHRSLLTIDDDLTSLYHTEMLNQLLGLDERLTTPFMIHCLFNVLPQIKEPIANIRIITLLNLYVQYLVTRHNNDDVDIDMIILIAAQIASNMYENHQNCVTLNIINDIIDTMASINHRESILKVLPLEHSTNMHGEQCFVFKHSLLYNYFLAEGTACRLKTFENFKNVQTIVLQTRYLSQSNDLVKLLGELCDINDNWYEYIVSQLSATSPISPRNLKSTSKTSILPTMVLELFSTPIQIINDTNTLNNIKPSSSSSSTSLEITNSITFANLATCVAASNIGFTKIDLRQADISGADLRGVYLDNVNVDGANFENVNLSNSIIRNVSFTDAQKESINFNTISTISVQNSIHCLPPDKITCVCLHDNLVIAGYVRSHNNTAYIRIYDIETGIPLHLLNLHDQAQIVDGTISQIAVGSSHNFLFALVIQPRNRIVISNGIDDMFMLSTGHDHDPNDVFHVLFTSSRYLSVVSGNTVFVHDLNTNYIIQRKTFQAAWHYNSILYYLQTQIFNENHQLEVSDEHFRSHCRRINISPIMDWSNTIYAVATNQPVMAWYQDKYCHISFIDGINERYDKIDCSNTITALSLDNNGEILIIGYNTGEINVYYLKSNVAPLCICIINGPLIRIDQIKCHWLKDKYRVELCVISELYDLMVWSINTKKKRKESQYPSKLLFRVNRNFSLLN